MNRKSMKNILIEMIIVFIVFFMGTAGIIAVDDICIKTTGEGGKLVLDVDK